MSKMSDLTEALDELTLTGNQLIATGQKLVAAVSRLRDSFTAPEEAPPPARQKKAKPAPPPEPPAQNAEPPADTPEAPKPPEEAPAPLPTKEEMRALLADLATGGHRDEAREIVARYSGGKSFSDIDPQQYPLIVEEVKRYA